VKRRRARARILPLVLLLAAVPLACRTPGPAPAALPPPLARDDGRPAAMMAALEAIAATRTSLRANARVSIEGQGGASFARQLVLVERPARLRLEVLGVLGQRVAVLASDGARYDLYRAEKPELESGEVHPGILYEVAGLAITPEEVVQLALGAPIPTSPAPRVADASELPDGGVRVELAYKAGELQRTLEFDRGLALVRYAVRDPEGQIILDARYADFRPVEHGRFAFHIEVSLPVAQSRANIQFQSVELNPTLPDDLFRLPQRAPGASTGGPTSTARCVPAAGAPWSPSAS
jgi:hypothetical protein